MTTRWWRPFEPCPLALGEPYTAVCKTFDIPETVAACIQNAAPGLVAIVLSRHGGRAMVEAAEAAAKERGARVIWWWGPGWANGATPGALRGADGARSSLGSERPDAA